jgi:hypothetical protein
MWDPEPGKDTVLIGRVTNPTVSEWVRTVHLSIETTGACAMCWYSSFVIITSHIEVECGLSHSHAACHFNSQYG